MARRKLVRIQAEGQVTIPAEVLKKVGLRKGDLVEVLATRDGVLMTPQAVRATKTLHGIGEILRSQGLSLEELIESGLEERGALIEEYYGSRPDDEAD